MKKSCVVTALPNGVLTEILPLPVPVGTVVAMLVAAEELTVARLILNRTSLLTGLVSKFVPVTVTEAPGTPTLGVKLVMVGAPLELVTVKAALLVAEPLGVVIAINPVVAPAGTVVTICVAVEEVTAAASPLKVTVFWLGVVLYPVPWTVTVVPTGPLLGLKSIIETCEEL